MSHPFAVCEVNAMCLIRFTRNLQDRQVVGGTVAVGFGETDGCKGASTRFARALCLQQLATPFADLPHKSSASFLPKRSAARSSSATDIWSGSHRQVGRLYMHRKATFVTHLWNAGSESDFQSSN